MLARAGLCSRRDAERWIAEGRVSVDGAVLTTPAVTVTAGERDPGRRQAAARAGARRGCGATTSRPGSSPRTATRKGRPTVFDALPAELPRLISIGRLDLNSEGLLLLTNDGALARRLELPATGWLRRYRVRVHGAVEPARLAALEKGVTVDGVAYGPIRGEPRPPAGQQRLDHAGAARGQEPRGAPGARASGLSR